MYKPITSDFSESHLTARMVTKKPYGAEATPPQDCELLSAAPGMMLLALLTAPVPPSQPEITSMGETDKETGLYMPFLSLLICLSLVGFLPNNGIVK